MSKKSSSKEKAPAEASGKTKSDAPFDPQSLIGEKLDDRYEIEKCIGRGGMGVVYLASQSALDRKVVIKVLPPSFVGDEEASARFEREARGMSKLQHPHIVAIYDFGYRAGQAYIVMEYVEGITLRRLIKSSDQIDFATFGAIALQLLEGISEAHSLGLVHRDIKPSNIMLTDKRGEQNYVKILDFGLAKLVKGARDVTKEQNLVGSVAFLAPEQIMGNDTDERVDVYALGVLFYYMLTGEKPFTGDDDVAVLYQHVHNDPERLEKKLPQGHDIPQQVIELIHRALAKDPAERPYNAGQFLFEFGACLDGTDISSPHVSGEFNAVSRVAKLSSLSPDDPSEQIARQRNETPLHQIPPDATPSHSGLVALGADPSSGQVTWVSGEHLIKVEKQNRLRNILLGVLGALLIGGAGVFFYMQQADVPSQEEMRTDINQAVALVDEGKLGQAENALEMLQGDLEHHPELKRDYVAAQDRLEIAQLMANASFYEEDGDTEQAVAAYKKVLSRDPAHEAARERLRALRNERQQREDTAGAQGTLTVKSEPAAMVFVDDLPVGQSPIDHKLSVGAHTIEVRKKGYKTLSRKIEVTEGQQVPVRVELEEASQPTQVERVAPDTAKKRAAGSRAPQKNQKKASGAKKAQSGSSSATKKSQPSKPATKPAKKTADTPEKSAGSTAKKATDEKTADKKTADKKKEDKADDGLLLDSDEGSGDLLPADDGSAEQDLLLD